MAGQLQIEQLFERLETDTAFAEDLENDPFGALREGGFDDLTTEVARERDRIAELVGRIYEDEEFRLALERDPAYELAEWGVPEVAMEAVLIVAGAPEEVIDRAAADFEAHLFGKKPATVAAIAAVLGSLAFAQQASASSSPELSTQVQPAVTAQVVNPELTAQVRSAVVSSQVRRAVKGNWHGAAVKPAVWQNRLVSILRAQNLAS